MRIICTAKLDKAEKYLKHAKKLGSCEEIDIAEAFIFSQKGDKQAALGTLNRINSPMSRSAALLVVANHEGTQRSVDWLKRASIDASDLDSEGKYLLLGYHLELANWEAARECRDSADTMTICVILLFSIM